MYSDKQMYRYTQYLYRVAALPVIYVVRQTDVQTDVQTYSSYRVAALPKKIIIYNDDTNRPFLTLWYIQGFRDRTMRDKRIFLPKFLLLK